MPNILILGGTTEARLLATALSHRDDLKVTLSLAGRTAAPVTQPVPVRSGGFGGVAGLADYLQREHIAALIDATHPYAEIISANAVAAARAAAVPLIALRRPAWQQVPDDKWRDVGDVAEAIEALGEKPRRVLVTVGRNGLAPLTAAPRHYYVIRSVDPVEPPLEVPQADYITARGPVSAAA
ncbi:MAG: cobalt-precorrin-6A reductase, partial [Alphaproteobacteria bacterium]|nr:cobalt-precorrin-6A reductase [Alphaproteobacteria bacterium]